MSSAVAKRIELLAQSRRFWHEPGRRKDLLDVEFFDLTPIALQRAQQIFRVQHADDVIGLVTP